MTVHHFDLMNILPLVVDIDGTLKRSDLLAESGFSLIRHRPNRSLKPPVWLAAAKANLKRRFAPDR